MKKIVFFLIIALIIGACASQQGISDSETVNKNIEIELNDSTEYLLITFDFAFDTWFLRYKNSGDHHSLDYYKTWNQRYVDDWNIRVNSDFNHHYFKSSLFISPEEIDNLEIQHELFYYFQYVEYVLHIKILYGASPKAVI